jgi:hypothetical protein
LKNREKAKVGQKSIFLTQNIRPERKTFYQTFTYYAIEYGEKFWTLS